MPARLFEELRAIGAKPRLHICGNTRKILGGMGQLGTVIGDLDPARALRDGTLESVLAAVRECHRLAGEGFILGAGCEIPRGTAVENVRSLAVATHLAG